MFALIISTEDQHENQRGLSLCEGIPLHTDFPRSHHSLFNNCMAINFLFVICKESYGCRPIGGNPKLHHTCPWFTHKQLQMVQIVTSEFPSFTNKIYRERARPRKRLHCLQVKCKHAQLLDIWSSWSGNQKLIQQKLSFPREYLGRSTLKKVVCEVVHLLLLYRNWRSGLHPKRFITLLKTASSHLLVLASPKPQ